MADGGGGGVQLVAGGVDEADAEEQLKWEVWLENILSTFCL